MSTVAHDEDDAALPIVEIPDVPGDEDDAALPQWSKVASRKHMLGVCKQLEVLTKPGHAVCDAVLSGDGDVVSDADWMFERSDSEAAPGSPEHVVGGGVSDPAPPGGGDGVLVPVGEPAKLQLRVPDG